MIYILSKILLFLIKPLVWFFAISFFAIFTKSNPLRKKLIIISCGLLFICSNTFLVGKIANAYEVRHYPTKKSYDFGILLGGFSGINKRNNEIAFGWANDRLLQAVKLLQTGRIKKLIISSGNANLFDKEVKEADLVSAYLAQIGIPDSLIIKENQARNTSENAKNSFAIVNQFDKNNQILVITSAWHIPRAKINFERYFKEGIDFYPTNFLGKDEYGFNDFIIPNPSAISDLELLIKEWIGLLIDEVRN